MKNKVTYRQQYTRCGKQRCRKCKEGPGHGPYWYAFYSEKGRTVSKYIGIHAPADLNISQTSASAVRAQTAPAAPGNGFPAIVGATDQAEITPTNEATLEKEMDGQPVLRIYVLGHFRIELRNGNEWVPVTNRTWQRRRARALLGCLLSNSGRRLGREQAMEALWPDLDIDTAANRLNGAVHEVRQVLEPGLSRPAASRMLRLERDMLLLADASLIWVDTEAFEKLLNKSNTLSSPAEVEQAIEEALLLYGGDYLLEELYSEWAAPRRESLRRSWMGLLLKLAELRAGRGAYISAIEPLDRLLTSDPTHETAVRRLMELLTLLDRRGEAFQVYHRLVETLRREYESEPLSETTALYRALRQGTYQIPRPVVLAATPAPALPEASQPAELSPDTEPSPVFPRPALQLVRHNQSKLVGRDNELETMQQFLHAIESLSLEKKNRRKTAHFMLLLGESGIGKTRLAEELSYEADQRGWSVVWAHGYEQEGTIPYRPWAEIFRALLKDIQPSQLIKHLEARIRSSPTQDAPPSAGNGISPAQARLARINSLVPELGAFEVLRDTFSTTPEQERLHLWEAASAVLGILSRSAPLLLVLDDLHWTDDSSLALLAYVVRHMQYEHIAIVATARDGELAQESNLSTLMNDLRREQTVLTLPVKPLNEISIGSLVAHLPEYIVQDIQRQAGGNPFFAEELARVSETSLADMNTPESIKAVLERRLSKLSSDCQVLLGKAAVLGGSFALSQLIFLAGDQGANEESIFDLLEEALRAGLLTEEGTGARITYHFWHPLIVNHLYERQSAARRGQLHRKAAHALIELHQGNPDDVAATITHHLVRGGSDITQVGQYAELAGSRAFSQYAFAEAEYYYRLAVDAITRSGQTRQVEDPLHLASILERIAECNTVHGNFEELRRLYEQVLELRALHCSRSEGGVSMEEAQRQALIWREIGNAWSENGNMEEAMHCYEVGQQVMLDAGVMSGAAWACLRQAHGNLNWRLGNNEIARRYAQEALEMLEPIMRQQEQEKQALPIAATELPSRTAL
ncbi:MAG TPA: DUF6788 family protein, partial [Ktedonobacteraceae bacterium]|nr:DUF6788 family protein [Ktedonobacteraceae bacterium]